MGGGETAPSAGAYDPGYDLVKQLVNESCRTYEIWSRTFEC